MERIFNFSSSPSSSSSSRPRPRARPGARARFALTSRPLSMMKKTSPLTNRRFPLCIILSSGKMAEFTMDPATTKLRHLAAFVAVQEQVGEEALLLKVENAASMGKGRNKAKFKRVSTKAADRNLVKSGIGPHTRIVVHIDLAKVMDAMLSI